MLELMEREMQLRQQEAVRLAEWEQQVRESAGPEAEQLVSEVRSQFTGVIAVVEPSALTPEQVPPAAAPSPLAPSPAAPSHHASVPPTPPPAPVVPPSGPELDLALADAPPPLGAAITAVPPPPGSVPPPPPALVEPSVPEVAVAAVSTPTAFEALLAAADAATGETSAAPEPVGDAVVDEPWRMEQPDDGDVDQAALSEPDSAIAADDLSNDDVVAAPDRAARVETTALEPTPAELRTGRSIRLFWMWFAVNSSIVSLALGAVLLGLGMSLRQSILAALIGVAVSFLPLGLGTLASKWSGQPTMVVSRATFGTAGNVIPAVLAALTRLVWAGALLWILGIGVAEVLVGGSVVEGLSRL
ncbi:MAG: cytosine permease, partial [Microcella sp.]|nr:cytosine permease [Microcella sp.]